ncbi:hypothetical protein GCM10027612_37670 [Microbispora bryophytorum subsp. camponoti]
MVTVEGLAGAAGGPHGELRAGPDGERDGERDGGPGGGLNRGPDSGLTEVQRAFADAGAVQCGFCTPGLVVQAHALLADGDGVPPDADIREALAGNLCRCTGYEKILDAVRLAAARRHPHPRRDLVVCRTHTPPPAPEPSVIMQKLCSPHLTRESPLRDLAPRGVVIENAYVVPVVGEEIPSGHVVVEDGLITAVGPGPAPRLPEGAERVDGSGCLATPGLVNTHHHLYQWASQG